MHAAGRVPGKPFVRKYICCQGPFLFFFALLFVIHIDNCNRTYYHLLYLANFMMELKRCLAAMLCVQGIHANAVLRFGCSQVVVERLDP